MSGRRKRTRLLVVHSDHPSLGETVRALVAVEPARVRTVPSLDDVDVVQLPVCREAE